MKPIDIEDREVDAEPEEENPSLLTRARRAIGRGLRAVQRGGQRVARSLRGAGARRRQNRQG